MTTALTVARAGLLVLLGATVSLATVVTHGRPAGLALGVAASVAGAWALPGGWTWRFPYTAGWVVFLGYALMPRSGGGYLLGSDLEGYLVLGLGLALMVFGIVTVRPLRPAPPLDP